MSLKGCNTKVVELLSSCSLLRYFSYMPCIAFSICAGYVPFDNFTSNCEAELVLFHSSQSPGFKFVFSKVALDTNIENVKSVFWLIFFTMPVIVVGTVSLKYNCLPMICSGESFGKYNAADASDKTV